MEPCPVPVVPVLFLFTKLACPVPREALFRFSASQSWQVWFGLAVLGLTQCQINMSQWLFCCPENQQLKNKMLLIRNKITIMVPIDLRSSREG